MTLKAEFYTDPEIFYELPKELFDDYFKESSIGAKVLYAILRFNGYRDELGIYCKLSVKALSEIMGCSEKSISRYKKQLSEYYLIVEQKQSNSTNKIYVNRV